MTYFFKFLITVSFAATLTGLAQAGNVRQADTVVELFTSQGCSSCPPADKIMGELVKNPAILGLSYAVTYWDYIGWKDIFGSPKNDERQVRYRDRMKARYVYTPQMVIAGEEHFVGSNAAQLKNKLQQFQGHAKAIPLKWYFEGSTLKVELPASQAKAVIWQVDIDHNKPVKIRRGENTGKVLTYHNVVRDTRKIGTWNGQKKIIS
ncbi:MAG: DUF1223 domain-containing protein, partial [Sneathiella sp.]|nr:DUF1223 domain-containing protein [Sneathiella sp.]